MTAIKELQAELSQLRATEVRLAREGVSVADVRGALTDMLNRLSDAATFITQARNELQRLTRPAYVVEIDPDDCDETVGLKRRMVNLRALQAPRPFFDVIGLAEIERTITTLNLLNQRLVERGQVEPRCKVADVAPTKRRTRSQYSVVSAPMKKHRFGACPKPFRGPDGRRSGEARQSASSMVRRSRDLDT